MGSIYLWNRWRRYLASIGLVAASTLALAWLAQGVQQTTIALFYLLDVLICATTFGLGPAILVSGLAFLAFNFFFVHPLYTFDVAEAQDLLQLLIFLVVAIVTGSLAGRARTQAGTASRRAAELAALYDMSQSISTEVDLERILPVVARTTARLLDVAACSILLYDDHGRLVERAAHGAQPSTAFRRVDTFLRVGQRVLGVLRVAQSPLGRVFSPAEQKLLETIAAQLVLLLERSRLVEEISRTQAQAQSERLKSALVSSVSHDLRTPLAVIKGAVTNLLDESVAWDSAARRDLLGAVNHETDRLNRVVGNLLEMSRIESGALSVSRSWQDIGELVRAVVDRVRSQMGARRVVVDIPEDLPMVQVNYTQLDQVLTNLLENALKYTPDQTQVAIAARAVDGVVRVEVRDEGPGIPDTMIARIFDKFVRAGGPEQADAGSGLGLAICKGLVEAHGGQIWAENVPDGGVRFVFTIPRGGPAPGGETHGDAELAVEQRRQV